MKKGIAVIKWKGNLALAKIVTEGNEGLVMLIPRKVGNMKPMSFKAADIEKKLRPVYLASVQLNDSLKMALEG